MFLFLPSAANRRVNESRCNIQSGPAVFYIFKNTYLRIYFRRSFFFFWENKTNKQKKAIHAFRPTANQNSVHIPHHNKAAETFGSDVRDLGVFLFKCEHVKVKNMQQKHENKRLLSDFALKPPTSTFSLHQTKSKACKTQSGRLTKLPEMSIFIHTNPFFFFTALRSFYANGIFTQTEQYFPAEISTSRPAIDSSVVIS